MVDKFRLVCYWNFVKLVIILFIVIVDLDFGYGSFVKGWYFVFFKYVFYFFFLFVVVSKWFFEWSFVWICLCCGGLNLWYKFYCFIYLIFCILLGIFVLFCLNVNVGYFFYVFVIFV